MPAVKPGFNTSTAAGALPDRCWKRRTPTQLYSAGVSGAAGAVHHSRSGPWEEREAAGGHDGLLGEGHDLPYIRVTALTGPSGYLTCSVCQTRRSSAGRRRTMV